MTPTPSPQTPWSSELCACLQQLRSLIALNCYPLGVIMPKCFFVNTCCLSPPPSSPLPYPRPTCLPPHHVAFSIPLLCTAGLIFNFTFLVYFNSYSETFQFPYGVNIDYLLLFLVYTCLALCM